MGNEMLKPFFESVPAVFFQMFGLEVKNAKPAVVDGNESHNWEVSGLLGITGSNQGIIALRFARNTVDELLKASGVESSDEQDRLAMTSSLVAETANIIAGNAIAAFSDKNLDIAPPVVVKGVNHEISWPKIAPVLAAVYSSAYGAFELAVCFDTKS